MARVGSMRMSGESMRERIIAAIRTLTEQSGQPPTNRELGEYLGGKSTGHMAYHLRILMDEGRIRHQPGKSRGLLLADEAPANIRPLRPLSIPLAGTIAAGRPIEAVEDRDAVIDLAADIPHDENVFALRVKGTSMIDDHIEDGDIVLVRRQSTASNGETVVALLKDTPSASGEATLKRFYREAGGKIRLQPANAMMQPIVVDARIVEVQGKVIGVYRKV